MRYANKHCENGSVYVALSDLTSFEWEKVYIFENRRNPQFIEEIIGIKYDESLDLVSVVIIFIRNNEIVYDEFIYLDFDGKSRFYVYINFGIEHENRVNYRVFDNNAVFEIGREESEKYGFYYWLKAEYLFARYSLSNALNICFKFAAPVIFMP
jgi:hypothetical protein